MKVFDRKTSLSLDKSKDQQQTSSLCNKEDRIKKRLLEIEQLLRRIFKDNFISVRKAFLTLDSDHDGLVTIEDFYRSFN